MQRRWKLILGLILLLLTACGQEQTPALETTPVLKTVSQWAIAAEASSQFGFPDWSARRATGAPDVNACADDPRAWASARGGGLQWLQLTYAYAVHVTEVEIYQTFGRGAISRVSLIGEDGSVEEIWSGTDVTNPCPGTLTISVPRTPYRVKNVRIDLDESRTGFWNQIDAVALTGVR